MAIDAAAAVAGTSATSASRTRLAENFDTFLSLLTTQLKNQDPLSPLDSNQFTQQLTQMTGVEQQLLTNDLLTKLVGNTGAGIAGAVSLIGKEVRAVSDSTAIAGGKATWTYNLDRAASDVKIEILNAKGAVVQTAAGSDNGAGDHSFTWDGKTATGATMTDGIYTLRITAKDSNGAAVTPITYVDGLVTGVEQVDGATKITINGGQVSWDKVTKIRQPATTTTTSTDTVPTTGTGA